MNNIIIALCVILAAWVLLFVLPVVVFAVCFIVAVFKNVMQKIRGGV